MKQSGAKLIEVGTTNITELDDYKNAMLYYNNCIEIGTNNSSVYFNRALLKLITIMKKTLDNICFSK